MSAPGYLWRNHRIAVLGFALALTLALFFTVRFVVFSIYWADPAHRNATIEGWMTPGYVAYSYDLPPEAIRDALKLAPGTRPHRSLNSIAKETGVPLDVLIGEIKATIARARTAPDG